MRSFITAMKTKTTITVETWQTTRVTQTRASELSPCPVCGTESKGLTANETARRLGTGENEIFRMIAAGELHILQTGSRLALICGGSRGR